MAQPESYNPERNLDLIGMSRRKIMAEIIPGPEGLPVGSTVISSGVEKQTRPWHISPGYDPKRAGEYQTKEEGGYNIIFDPQTGKEVARVSHMVGGTPRKPTVNEVIANTSLIGNERLQATQKSLGTQLTPQQEQAVLQAHSVGSNEPGKDQSEAGIYNYTQAQLLQKARILKEAGFSKEQRRELMETGLVGRLLPSEIVIDPNVYPDTSPLRPITEEILDRGAAGEADEDFLSGITERIQNLIDTRAVTYTDAKTLLKDVKMWQITAKEKPATLGDSAFEQAKSIYDWYESRERKRALTSTEQATKNAREAEMATLIDEASQRGVLEYLYQDIKNLYSETIAVSVSRYGDGSRRTTTERIEMARNALNNYQETFWDYGNPALNGLDRRYKGVAAYLASRICVAIEKDFKGIALSPTEIGDRAFNLLKRDIERERERREQENLEKNAFWDRHWGSVVLTGTTEKEVNRGVRNFLQIATSDESNFDPQRYIEDGTRLNQEIQRVGKQVGMDQSKIVELVAEAEGTLFINVARYFAVRWHVNEWHQIASLIGKHIDTRLNAVTKAHKAEVMHVAYLLDSDPEYDKYGRPARFASEKSSKNDQVAKSEIKKVQRQLEVRIALSELKDINKVIREHFTGIETQIDGFGFNRSARDPRTGELIAATELFKNPQYLAEIERINQKLITLNQKYAQNQPVIPADKLTDIEKKLLILDRIRPYERTEDLVLIDQTDEQFRNLYTEYGGFSTKAAYDAEILRLQPLTPPLQQKRSRNESLTDAETEQLRFWERNEVLKRMERGGKLTDSEVRAFPEISRARQAVDLAIKTRDVFFINAEKACASLITTHNTVEGNGELLSYNDVVRFNKFVRERVIIGLPVDIAAAITGTTRGGAGLMYVDIADKLEFINLSKRVIAEKKEDSEFGKNAEEALLLIKLTTDETKYATYVQAVEDIQEEVLKELKTKGSSLTVADIDAKIQATYTKCGINFATRQAARDQHSQTTHRGETTKKSSTTYDDIVNREDADPQYNFSMMDDQKYSSLLLSDENRAAAYNPDHPYYHSIPATARRVLDPDGIKLIRKPDADLERTDAFRLMEMQRRFHFAVDSVKVFGAWYQPDLYSDKAVPVEYVQNIRNSPFIARRMIEQRFWTLWNRGQAYRGRGFLKYLESNFRGLDHSVGRRGLRGIVASYNGFSPKGFAYDVDFSGALDELKAELWLDQAKGAEAVRPVLVGGQVGQDPNFEGLFKKIVKTIGRNNYTLEERYRNAQTKGAISPLQRIAIKDWMHLEAGDYEKAIDEIEDRWKRVTIYGNSLGFVGNTSHVPLAAKFSGDTAVRRLVYWAVVHPEAESAYNINMDLTRTILRPLGEDKDWAKAYFGPYSTLLTELIRRAILMK